MAEVDKAYTEGYLAGWNGAGRNPYEDSDDEREQSASKSDMWYEGRDMGREDRTKSDQVRYEETSGPSEPLPKGWGHKVEYGSDPNQTATMHFSDGSPSIRLTASSHDEMQNKIRCIGHKREMAKGAASTAERKILTDKFNICC